MKKYIEELKFKYSSLQTKSETINISDFNLTNDKYYKGFISGGTNHIVDGDEEIVESALTSLLYYKQQYYCVCSILTTEYHSDGTQTEKEIIEEWFYAALQF